MKTSRTTLGQEMANTPKTNSALESLADHVAHGDVLLTEAAALEEAEHPAVATKFYFGIEHLLRGRLESPSLEPEIRERVAKAIVEATQLESDRGD